MNIADEVLKEVDSRKNELVKLVQELIRYKTVNPPGDTSDIAGFIKDYLHERGLSVKLYEPQNGKVSVISVLKGDGERRFIWDGHVDVVPVTPEGIPTPALITRAALKLAEIPAIVVSGGLKINPQIPFVELGGSPGRDIRTGNAVENVKEVLERAKVAGENLAKTVDYLVVGESVPGGTTTALGVLMAMGI
ncbi:MAG: hypothetical protein QW279_11625, partial [Candidatus Jordarchaeaceae archaeon]